jgi:hypothetical protein
MVYFLSFISYIREIQLKSCFLLNILPSILSFWQIYRLKFYRRTLCCYLLNLCLIHSPNIANFLNFRSLLSSFGLMIGFGASFSFLNFVLNAVYCWIGLMLLILCFNLNLQFALLGCFVKIDALIALGSPILVFWQLSCFLGRGFLRL